MSDKKKLASNLKEIMDEIDNIQIFADKMNHSSPSDAKALVNWLLELRQRCSKLFSEQLNPIIYPKFRPHDSVRRKDHQGRAEMFVESIDEGTGIITCGWFAKCVDGKLRPRTEKFGENALEFVVPEGQPQPKTTEELLEEAAEWNRKRQEWVKAKEGQS